MDNFETLLLVGGFASLLFFLIGIVLYVLFSIGLYGLANNEKLRNNWFAFIPILQLYIIGKILDEIKIGNYQIKQLDLILPLSPIILLIADSILGFIPVIGTILSFIINIAYAIFCVFIMFNFYKRYRGDKATLMTILSIVLFFMGPIYVFGLRNASSVKYVDTYKDSF